MNTEYFNYLDKTENKLEQQYASLYARQQTLRNYAYMTNSPRAAAVPVELGIVLNYLYEHDIKSTKFNDIDLESSIFNSLIINDL